MSDRPWKDDPTLDAEIARELERRLRYAERLLENWVDWMSTPKCIAGLSPFDETDNYLRAAKEADNE